ncbi:MAG TPA: sulfatase-like hydrolase/transferase [Polyangiaceae bacterium]|nr:sulfatase-like hydrolase/transferase [Polyangiaceae bacterium]
MRELASSASAPAPAAPVTAEKTQAVAAAPVFDVLVGSAGLAAGFLGSLVLAVTTVSCRWVEVPYLYTRPRDAILHLALEVACGAALWLLLWLLVNGALLIGPRVPKSARGPVRLAALVGVGLAVGLFVYFRVVRISTRSAVLPASVWVVLLGGGGIALSIGGSALLRVRAERPRVVGCLLLGAALGIHAFALARYVRHYGNLQTIGLFCVAFLASLGTGLALGVPRLRGFAGRLALGALATSVLFIALFGAQPTFATRRAVLVWGGVAKRTMLSVVWPLFDRDSDGSPARFWGVDPDDARADVTPRSAGPGAGRSETLALDARLAPAPHRNLLWVTVDTVRRDSFDRLVAEQAELRAAFAGFADHKSYVSCSSRTGEVVGQLLGVRRCDPRAVEGLRGHSMLELLRAAGYHDRLVGLTDSRLSFERKEIFENDDPRTLARAGEVLREGGEGVALFVHLRGGHGEYEGPGRTPRERYENQLSTSLHGVARLLRDAPAERWAVVVLGDHGEAFGEHVSVGHATTLYEEALRTPLLVRGPNVAAGPVEQRVSCPSVPWFALHAMGVIDREPASLPLQYAVLDIAPGEIGHLQGDHLRSLRIGSNKVIWSSDLGLYELYDLEADPGELYSVAESRPGELAPLRAKLDELSRDCPGSP